MIYIAITNMKLRIMSKILSKYLPLCDGVFFMRDNSPSAASRMDFRMRKIAESKYFSTRILYTAASPQTPNRQVT